MTKVLTFKVEVDSLEDKIWREIEITDNRTVSALAYSILATFHLIGAHLYDIEYKNKFYDCWIDIEDDYRDVVLVNAVTTKLKEMSIKPNDTMVMSYDTGTTITFTITYLGESEFKRGNGMHYPYITKGSGYGVIDDCTNRELKDIIKDIDKKGESHYYAPCFDGRRRYLYDYRKFNLDKNNLHVRRCFFKLKCKYENYIED